MHIMENIAEKKNIYKVKPTFAGIERERAMSTMIDRKAPIAIDL
jgi:hypothetical protein